MPLPLLQVRVLGGDERIRGMELGPIPLPHEESDDEHGVQGAPPPGCGPPASQAAPAVAFGDGAVRFSEAAAAAGALGRFPGSEVMPLVKRFACVCGVGS